MGEFSDKLTFWVNNGKIDESEAYNLYNNAPEEEQQEWLRWAKLQEAKAEALLME